MSKNFDGPDWSERPSWWMVENKCFVQLQQLLSGRKPFLQTSFFYKVSTKGEIHPCAKPLHLFRLILRTEAIQRLCAWLATRVLSRKGAWDRPCALTWIALQLHKQPSPGRLPWAACSSPIWEAPKDQLSRRPFALDLTVQRGSSTACLLFLSIQFKKEPLFHSAEESSLIHREKNS